MGKITALLSILGIYSFFAVSSVFAASVSPEITKYTTDTLNLITIIASTAAVLFIVKGGYLYITSTGNPQAIEQAKKTIRNAVIGLVIVLSASVLVSVFRNALITPSTTENTSIINLEPINSVKPSDGLTQVLIDAVSGFIQNIVESATQPIVNGILTFLTTTPTLMNNSVVFNFWLISLGIVDSLFVLVIALLGLHFMSATTLGFEEVELKQLLPRIGIAFLGANLSLFLADYVIITCNALVKAIIDSTGGLNHAWIINAITLSSLTDGSIPLITLIFLVLFLIISIVLLLFYISRLIFISLAVVLSPFIFLLWTIPKFADTAEIAVKSYFVSVFVIFTHIIVIQLASSFLTLPEHTNNSMLSILVAIGLFLTLLKTPSMMMQIVFYTSRNGTFKNVGRQIINVLSTSNNAANTGASSIRNTVVKLPRKVIKA